MRDWDNPRPPVLENTAALLSADECRRYSDALADVLCWFRGFEAAHLGREDRPDLPPGLDALRSLNIMLKRGTP